MARRRYILEITPKYTTSDD
jgi:hypothetical protein